MRRRLNLSRHDLEFLTDETIEAFWLLVKDRSIKVDDMGREPCWEWLGATDGKRGLFSFKVKSWQVTIFAHHVAHYLRTGEIPEGRGLRLCTPGTTKGNPRSVTICSNPVHWGLKDTAISSNGQHQPTYSRKMPLFTQGDLRNIRVSAERTALARDVAKAEGQQLTPAEIHLIVLAEKILAALPTGRLGDYQIVRPAAGTPKEDPVSA